MLYRCVMLFRFCFDAVVGQRGQEKGKREAREGKRGQERQERQERAREGKRGWMYGFLSAKSCVARNTQILFMLSL
jgi:hypothetical protein